MPTEQPPIAFVITRGDSIGGAQIHVRDMASALHRRGTPVVVLTGSTGPFTETLSQRGVPWRVCPGLGRAIHPLKDIQAIREVHRALLIHRPKLVSTHTAKAGLVGRVAAWWAGIPAVFTVHGWQFAPGISPKQRLMVYGLELFLSRLQRKRSRVIAVSRYDLRLARKSAAVPPQQLRLVHNGLPWLDAPSRRPVQLGNHPNKPKELLMIARFQAQKDHTTLLRALAQIPANLPWHLTLVGEPGPLSESVEQLITTLKLNAPGRSVTCAGHRSDIPEILARTDVFCLISHWEGLPRSIIEAMRAALPVVASDVGGNRELVVPGVTGTLVPEGDEKALADELTALLTDDIRRHQWGMAGRKRYEQHFTFDAMLTRTEVVWGEFFSLTGRNDTLTGYEK